MTSSDAYMTGKQHYWAGLPVTAMDTAETGKKIEWLSGFLDAKLEHATIKRQARRMNEKRSNV